MSLYIGAQKFGQTDLKRINSLSVCPTDLSPVRTKKNKQTNKQRVLWANLDDRTCPLGMKVTQIQGTLKYRTYEVKIM